MTKSIATAASEANAGPNAGAKAGLMACAVLLAAVAAPMPAAGMAGEWVTDTVSPGATVEARLIAATDATGGATVDDPIRAGVEVRLPGDWKAYWRSPGDAGLPPVLDLGETGDSAANISGHDFLWPAPERFRLFGLETFGYGEHVVFPLLLTPRTSGEPMSIRGRFEALVCDDICVPAAFDLSLDLGGGTPAITPDTANLINRFMARVPDDGAVSGLIARTVAAAPQADGQDSIRISAESRDVLDHADIIDVLVEAPGHWAFHQPAISIDADGYGFIADIPVSQAGGALETLIGADITVTIIGSLGSSESTLTVDGAAASLLPAEQPAPVNTLSSWALMIMLAFIGGLVLNAMPCVLPVLSLKLMSVIGYGQASPTVVRRGFLLSAAGIVTSFMALAAFVLAVRATGGAVGWGMQFQQPLFLVFLIVVLTAFAANLAGLFSLSLPSTVATRLGTVGSSPQGAAGGETSATGHFATGAFATLLATPCSAPFLGTAVAFALSRGTTEILAIFLALGMGMALPYLLVAAAPSLVRMLPRPGRWMNGLRLVMALALVATALWLLSVVAAQIGANRAALVGAMMAAAVGALWLRRSLSSGWTRHSIGFGAAAIAMLAFIIPVHADRQATGPGDDALSAWMSFDRAAITERVNDGRIVLVDVTADWCITCQVNKRLVLDRPDVTDRIATGEIDAMRADWTLPDDAIAKFLADHGRYGIPFNIVFGPGAPDGIALPEILTPGAVADALDRAAASG